MEDDDVDQIVDNLKQSSNWVRVMFMFGFVILLYVIIAPVVFVLMLVQALFVLISGEYNGNLRYFGAALAEYVLQILHYISYNSDVKPFPFTDFPSVETTADNSEDAAEEAPAKAKPAAAKRKVSAKKPSSARKASGKSATGKSPASKSTDADEKPAED